MSVRKKYFEKGKSKEAERNLECYKQLAALIEAAALFVDEGKEQVALADSGNLMKIEARLVEAAKFIDLCKDICKKRAEGGEAL